MINHLDDALSAWAMPLAGGHEPSFQLPAHPERELTVHLYLLEISDDARRHNAGRSPIQPSLRYLVTTSGSNTQEAHELLSTLLFSAFENHDFEIEFEPANSPLWVALKTPPRPAFVIRMPLDREEPRIRGFRVKEVSVGLHGLTSLHGQVLGRSGKMGPPGYLPLAQARVDLNGVNKYAYSDENGYFILPAVPAPVPDPDPKKRKPLVLVITARGCEKIYTVTRMGTADAPMIFCMGFPDLDH